MSSFGKEFILSKTINVGTGMIIGAYNQNSGAQDKILHIFPTDRNKYICDVRFFALPLSTNDTTFEINGETRQLQGGQIYRDATSVLKIKD